MGWRAYWRNVLTVDSEEATVPNRVLVKRVTVDYECEGKAFTMVFNDPTKIGAIVLGRADFERLRSKQADLAKEQPPQAPPVVINTFNPVNPTEKLSASTLGITVSDPKSVSFKPGIEMRSLWWHAESCQWFHPEGDS